MSDYVITVTSDGVPFCTLVRKSEKLAKDAFTDIINKGLGTEVEDDAFENMVQRVGNICVSISRVSPHGNEVFYYLQ